MSLVTGKLNRPKETGTKGWPLSNDGYDGKPIEGT